MLTFLAVSVINGLVWFALGYKQGKDNNIYLSEEEFQRAWEENQKLKT